MKAILTITAILITVGNIFGQLTDQKDLDRIKQSKLIIATTKDPILNQFLYKAVHEFWTLSEIVDTMPYDKAIEKVKENDQYLILCLGKSYALSLPYEGLKIGNWQYIYKDLRTGQTIQIMGKSKNKAVTRIHIPTFGDNDEITEELVCFGVTQLESMLRSMQEKGYNNNMNMRKMYNEKSASELREKILIIPEGWLSEGVSEELIKEKYPFPFQIVSYEEWRQAIINRQSGLIYGIIVPYPTAQAYVYPQFFVDCESGRVKAVNWPKTTGVLGISMTGNSSAYFNEFSYEQLAKIINDDINDK